MAALPPSSPLTPASPADVTLSSWFLEEEDEEKEAAAGEPGGRGDSRLALILLNRPLPPLTPSLFRRAGLVICADGGANRLYEAAPAWGAELASGGVCADSDAARAAFLPAAIVGDLDSLDPTVRAFYEAAGVAIAGAPADQDSTDLEKSLAYVRGWAAKAAEGGGGTPVVVVAAGALGGRLDHTLAAINTLFKAEATAADCDDGQPPISLVLLGDGSLARALPPGGVAALEPAACEGPACGLVALGPPVTRAASAGLAWDLGPGTPPLALGGLQSTSNAVVGAGAGGRARAVVEVGAGGRLLWVSEVRGG